MSQKKKPNLHTEEPKRALSKKEIICEIVKKKTKQKFLTENQKKYYDTLLEN
jgi:hypothetical protein